MSTLRATNLKGGSAGSAPNFPDGYVITGVATVGVLSASTFYGSGANLTGIDATSLKDTNGDVKAQANTSGVVITGVTTASGVKISTGIVTATSGIATVYADVVIGTPTGGFKTGAFTINNTDKTKDSLNELNNILGKDQAIMVTEGKFVYVSIDAKGKPIKIK